MGGSTAASSSPPKASTEHALKPQAKQPHLRRLAAFAACILLPGTPAIAQQTAPETSKERQPSTDRGDTIAKPSDYEPAGLRSEEHTSELKSLMRTSYAVFFLKNKTTSIELNKTKH